MTRGAGSIVPPAAAPAPTKLGIADRAARELLVHLLARCHGGAVIIEEAERRTSLGRPDHEANENARASARDDSATQHLPVVHIHSPGTWKAVASGGSIGLGRAYIDGWWSCDDLDDLVAFLRLLVLNLAPIQLASAPLDRIAAPAAKALTTGRGQPGPGDRDVDRLNIRAHYDLGDEFFSLFLDETMTYSCAVFPTADATLAEASREKLDRICQKLQLTSEHHVVEIGTGWGSFAVHAAAHYGCRVTTTTISERQYEYASRRVKEAGVEHLVTVLDEDYRDLDGSYDRLVSIEMIEAIDWRQHEVFFSACSDLLKPGGLMGVQAIVVADQSFERSKHREDFIRHFIFPGACLPSVEAIVRSTTRATDLQMISLEDLGRHYVETLRRWRLALVENAAKLASLGFGEEFRRMWEFNFCYCEASFAERHVSDVQVVLAKPGWRVGGLGPLSTEMPRRALPDSGP
jgi:cyclopropane-fatty-acyl-phospholipid synthase